MAMRDVQIARAAANPTTTLDDDARELLQRRMGRFGLILAVVAGSFLAYRVVALGVSQHSFDGQGWSLGMHGVAVAIFAALWGVARRAPRSSASLRRLEATGFLGGSTAFCLMALDIPSFLRPEFILVLALSLASFGRAAYVPSSGRRTATLGAVVAVPLLICVAVTYHRFHEPAAWLAVSGYFGGLSKTTVIVIRTVNGGVWWLANVTIATLTSQALYGMRRDMRRVQRLGRYELREKIGSGGMGDVYRAEHALLERPTAIKLLPLDAGSDRSVRFEREVQRTATLSHPNTVTIFDYGRTADGVFYYAMELIDGLTLEELVELAGPLSVGRVVHLLRHACGPLVEAHGVGLIHRDVKPANIMVTLPHGYGGVNEVAKVLDFGLAKRVEGGGEIEGSQVDVLRGTPMYMAPEAIRTPGAVDGRTDLYALGAVAYYLLTGRPVFDGASIIEVCSQHLYEAPDREPLDERGEPAIAALVLECLAKDPADRPASALEVLRRLDALAPSHRWNADEARAWWTGNRSRVDTLRGEQRRPTSLRSITITRGAA